MWKAIVHEWIGYGYNPRNVKGMVDAFKNGGIKRGAPKNKSHTTVIEQMRAEKEA